VEEASEYHSPQCDGDAVGVTLRVRNLGDLRLQGVRVSFSQYATGKADAVQFIGIRTLDPGQA
jgi:hypothetical protein